MKKFLAMALALSMMMAMSMTAFAGEDTLTYDTDYVEIDVDAKCVSDSTTVADVIAVDVSWDAMEFTYAEASALSWDAENMWVETAGEGAGWKDETKNITITNRSNVGITATAGYVSNLTNFSLTLGSNLTLDAATAGDASKSLRGIEKTGVITVEVASSSTATIDEDTETVARITVTIAKVEAEEESSS